MRFKLGIVFWIIAALTLASLSVAGTAQAAHRERWEMYGGQNHVPGHPFDTIVVGAHRNFGVRISVTCSGKATNSVAAGDFHWNAKRKHKAFVDERVTIQGRGHFHVILPKGRWYIHVRTSCNWYMTLPFFLDDIWYKGWADE